MKVVREFFFRSQMDVQLFFLLSSGALLIQPNVVLCGKSNEINSLRHYRSNDDFGKKGETYDATVAQFSTTKVTISNSSKEKTNDGFSDVFALNKDHLIRGVKNVLLNKDTNFQTDNKNLQMHSPTNPEVSKNKSINRLKVLKRILSLNGGYAGRSGMKACKNVERRFERGKQLNILKDISNCIRSVKELSRKQSTLSTERKKLQMLLQLLRLRRKKRILMAHIYQMNAMSSNRRKTKLLTNPVLKHQTTALNGNQVFASKKLVKKLLVMTKATENLNSRRQFLTRKIHPETQQMLSNALTTQQQHMILNEAAKSVSNRTRNHQSTNTLNTPSFKFARMQGQLSKLARNKKPSMRVYQQQKSANDSATAYAHRRRYKYIFHPLYIRRPYIGMFFHNRTLKRLTPKELEIRTKKRQFIAQKIAILQRRLNAANNLSRSARINVDPKRQPYPPLTTPSTVVQLLTTTLISVVRNMNNTFHSIGNATETDKASANAALNYRNRFFELLKRDTRITTEMLQSILNHYFKNAKLFKKFVYKGNPANANVVKSFKRNGARHSIKDDGKIDKMPKNNANLNYQPRQTRYETKNLGIGTTLWNPLTVVNANKMGFKDNDIKISLITNKNSDDSSPNSHQLGEIVETVISSKRQKDSGDVTFQKVTRVSSMENAGKQQFGASISSSYRNVAPTGRSSNEGNTSSIMRFLRSNGVNCNLNTKEQNATKTTNLNCFNPLSQNTWWSPRNLEREMNEEDAYERENLADSLKAKRQPASVENDDDLDGKRR